MKKNTSLLQSKTNRNVVVNHLFHIVPDQNKGEKGLSIAYSGIYLDRVKKHSPDTPMHRVECIKIMRLINRYTRCFSFDNVTLSKRKNMNTLMALFDDNFYLSAANKQELLILIMENDDNLKNIIEELFETGALDNQIQGLKKTSLIIGNR
jgi:hypothetical protein